MVSIDGKIIHWRLEEEVPKVVAEKPVMTERPITLAGKTYKLKSPSMKHAYYITINDNPDGNPFEIFISSQDAEHFQWIASLTRTMSAVFRRSEDVTFLIEELKAIVDPSGGLGFVKLVGMRKQKFIPSIPAALGFILEHHLKSGKPKEEEPKIEEKEEGYPETATVCKVCKEKAVVLLDGCETCLACSESKCG
jgi:hypothetical protein